ncbi:MAG: hypothetical protein ISS48_00875 [Candidatus Aenigmarchaeota archaeon]|nr:hypothetical protein [Candidatus Aenigmarchaeota archaeon]
MYPLAHYTIPVLFLLFLFKSDKKLILLLAPLTLMPDLDFFTNIHRLLFHNIFFVIGLSWLSYLLLGKLFKINNKKEFFFITLFLLGSHLLLDFDAYGVAFFYPLDNHILGFDFNKFHFMVNEYKDGFRLIFPFERIPKREVILIIILQFIFWLRSISEFYENREIKSQGFNNFITKIDNLLQKG